MEHATIRNAAYGMKEQILECSLSTYQAHRTSQPFAFPGNMYAALVAPTIEESFVNDRGAPLPESPNIFVAEVKGTFAGYVQLSRFTLDTTQTLPLCVISDIFVLPEFRKQGLASQLLSHVKQLAMDKRCSNLTATVWLRTKRQPDYLRKKASRYKVPVFGSDRQVRRLTCPLRQRRTEAS